MRHKLFRTHNPWLLSGCERFQESVLSDEEITLIRTAQNENVVGMRDLVSRTLERLQ